MKPLALRYVQKCASEVHLKVFETFETLEKAKKCDLLLYEFPAEDRFCQSFSGLFRDF